MSSLLDEFNFILLKLFLINFFIFILTAYLRYAIILYTTNR